MLAKLFAGPLAFLYWIVGLWGFFLSIQVIYKGFGILGVFIGIIIGPISFFLAPLYAGFTEGYWLPALVSYAPIAAMLVISIVASFFDR
jgi:hypothetical protein